MNEIKQFKLTSGDELVCEVVEWADEDNCDMVIRRAFTIVTQVSEESHRYHSFKPWMALQEGTDMYITLNSNHIISEANPDIKVLKFYHDAVNSAELTEEELNTRIKEYLARMEDIEPDDPNDNVVSFRSKKDTIH